MKDLLESFVPFRPCLQVLLLFGVLTRVTLDLAVGDLDFLDIEVRDVNRMRFERIAVVVEGGLVLVGVALLVGRSQDADEPGLVLLPDDGAGRRTTTTSFGDSGV